MTSSSSSPETSAWSPEVTTPVVLASSPTGSVIRVHSTLSTSRTLLATLSPLVCSTSSCRHHHQQGASSGFIRHCPRQGLCWPHFRHSSAVHLRDRQGSQVLRVFAQGPGYPHDHRRGEGQASGRQGLKSYILTRTFQKLRPPRCFST